MRAPEVPALPVLVPVAVAVFVFTVLRVRRRNALSVLRIVFVAALLVYGVGLLRSVLLPYPIVLGSARSDLPDWQVFVQLIPLATVPEDPSGMVLNVLLFVPLGFMLPMVLRRPGLLQVLAFGFLTSLVIEVVQLLGDLTITTGRIADVDDLIGNTSGTLVGLAVFLLLTRIPVVRRAATAATLRTNSPVVSRVEVRRSTS